MLNFTIELVSTPLGLILAICAYTAIAGYVFAQEQNMRKSDPGHRYDLVLAAFWLPLLPFRIGAWFQRF